MPEQEPTVEAIRDLLIDVCQIMQAHGYSRVTVGSIMRLVGVPDHKAGSHDNEWIDLTDIARPTYVTLH